MKNKNADPDAIYNRILAIRRIATGDTHETIPGVHPMTPNDQIIAICDNLIEEIERDIAHNQYMTLGVDNATIPG